jgi:hypothetical protein
MSTPLCIFLNSSATAVASGNTVLLPVMLISPESD